MVRLFMKKKLNFDEIFAFFKNAHLGRFFVRLLGWVFLKYLFSHGCEKYAYVKCANPKSELESVFLLKRGDALNFVGE